MDLKSNTLPALLAIIERLKQENPVTVPGKVHIQKICYFLQGKGVELGYRFRIYHYGPYSFDLANDLEYLNSLGLINIEEKEDVWGTSITVTEVGRKYMNKEKPEGFLEKLDDIVGKLGREKAKVLGLIATLHFVVKRLEERNEGKDYKKIIKLTHEMKPDFTKKYIKGKYESLKTLELV